MWIPKLPPALLPATVAFTIALVPVHALALDVDALAACIEESGTVLYGAHWCPQCARQIAMFDESAWRLPYVECYRKNSSDKRRQCIDITSYPTWEFPDGSQATGILTLRGLARRTGCPLAPVY